MAAIRERDLIPTISNLISIEPKLHTNIELILAGSKSSTRLPVTALFASITRDSCYTSNLTISARNHFVVQFFFFEIESAVTRFFFYKKLLAINFIGRSFLYVRTLNFVLNSFWMYCFDNNET